MNKKHFFITVEGLEGSGKSSVINHLRKVLRKKGFRVKVYREPGSTRVGEQIREILLNNKNKRLSKHTELLLYLAARTQLIEEKLVKDKRRYDFLVCDRFFDSTVVYQGCALGLGNIAEDAVKMFSLGVEPDLTIFLDAPVKEGLSRLGDKDRIESRPLSFHNRLRRGYLKLARNHPRRIIRIDGKGDLGMICRKAELVLNEFIARVKKVKNPKNAPKRRHS